jgi:HD superfamily phosphodiesterase
MNISDSLLIEELRKKDAQSTIENISKIRENVSPILGRISAFFTDYTNHDVSHCDQVVLNLNWIIPKKVINSLNRYEIQILLLACYLHDVGMALGESEADEIARTSDFQLYKRQVSIG